MYRVPNEKEKKVSNVAVFVLHFLPLFLQEWVSFFAVIISSSIFDN